MLIIKRTLSIKSIKRLSGTVEPRINEVKNRTVKAVLLSLPKRKTRASDA